MPTGSHNIIYTCVRLFTCIYLSKCMPYGMPLTYQMFTYEHFNKYLCTNIFIIVGSRTEHFCTFRCKITNKCWRVLSALLYSSNYPDMFRQLTAIFRGLHVPWKLLQFCLRLGWMWVMVPLVWPAAHRVTRHNTLIHNILSTAPQLSISQKARGTLPVDSNIMPKHVGATIHNQ
jgi:hypothetical protein